MVSDDGPEFTRMKKLKSQSFFDVLRGKPGGDESLSQLAPRLLGLGRYEFVKFLVSYFPESYIGGHTPFEIWRQSFPE